MPIADRIREEMTAAWRAGETRRRDILRLLIASLHNARIAAGHELTDAEALAVLQREASERRDSIEQYAAGGRADLVAREQEELALITGYLPAALTDEQLRAEAQAVIAEVSASAPGDLGRVMRPLMERVAGRAEGRRANELVRELLAAAP